jgi:hypothetical protein
MKKSTAILIQQQGLLAVEQLSSILYFDLSDCSEEEYARVKRGIGISIGEIQVRLLEVINHYYPELDHLKDVEYEERET